MARTAATIKDINQSTGKLNLTDSGFTTIDSTLVTAGLDITDFFNSKEGARCLLLTNTSAVVTGNTITIQAGTGVQSGLGDLSFTIAQNKQTLIGPLESARFDQGDGSLYVDFKTGVTGAIVAVGEKPAL